MSTPLWKKYVILFIGLLENLIFSGTIMGWSALNYMLKQEGIYGHVCEYHHELRTFPSITNNYSEVVYAYDFSTPGNTTIVASESTIVHNKIFAERTADAINNAMNNLLIFNNANTSNVTFIDEMGAISGTPAFSQLSGNSSIGCIEQDKLLNLAYTIGTFCMGFSAFIWGFLLDKWGLRTVRLLINVLITGGAVLLCFTNRDRSYLIFPSITLMCLAGVPLRIANMQLANLFPQKRSTVITFYSGAFSASAIIFVALKYLYDIGLSFSMVCLLLVIASILMVPFTFLLLPRDKVEDEGKNESTQQLFSGKSVNKTGLAIISPVTLEKFTVLSSPTTIRKMNLNNNNGMAIDDMKKVYVIKTESTSSSLSGGSSSGFVPLKISLCSWAFTLHQWWYSWLITYMIMYVGSLNLWLNRVTTDISTAANFAKLYGIVQVFALILAPIAGLIMDYNINEANKETDLFKRKLRRVQSGFWPKLFTTLTLAAILICRFFDNFAAVYVSIVFITLLRSFLIAVASAYLRIRFHGDHFNKLLGIMSTSGSFITLVQFPLFIWESKSDTDAFWVNVFNCVCTIFAFLSPLHLIITPLQKHLLLKEEAEETEAKLKRYKN